MRNLLMPRWLRGHCRLSLSRGAVSVLRMGTSRKSAPVVVDRPWSEPPGTAPDELAAQIAATLAAAGGSGLPVYATFADNLVRYFIVTPPGNCARMQDLRAAAEVRFVVLYGESVAGWQLVADWQAGAPFLACAVSRRLHTALQLAVRTERGCLVSASPNFVCAWNRERRRFSADAWPATLHEGALTLGLLAGGTRPRLAAVRTLELPEDAPPLEWLREQVARVALLDNLPAPSVLHLHGPLLDAWQPRVASSGGAGMTVHWCAADHVVARPASIGMTAAQRAGSGATP